MEQTGIIHNEIKSVRLARGMTLSQLAAQLGMTQPSLTRMENGEQAVSLARLGEIADVLGCAPYELLPREWQPAAPDYSDDDRMIRIWTTVDKTLRALHKNVPDDVKIRLVLYLFREGYAVAADMVANDNEVSRAVKLALRTA